jgi:hypothetical protein
MSGKVLKHKRHYSPRRFPKTRPARQAQPAAPASEPKRVYVGTVSLAPGETFALDVPAGADAATIAALIEAAEREKHAETQRLRQAFGFDGDNKGDER